jgi:hypothetical protein
MYYYCLLLSSRPVSQGLLLYAILVALAYKDYVLLLLLHDIYRDSQ